VFSRKINSQKSDAEGFFLPLDPNVSAAENIDRLRLDALRVHQAQMGRGDELVQILRRTIGQMERTHARVQAMSVTLFIAGLAVLSVGLYQAVANNENVWGSVIAGAGGLAAVAATFWTAPLDKLAASIRDLVQLEAAFLGYIRVIGEVDSAFQMQYLDLLIGQEDTKPVIGEVINETTQQMKDMMEHTLTLIDKFVGGERTNGLEHRLEQAEGRITALEH
jgi:hypothetical protein